MRTALIVVTLLLFLALPVTAAAACPGTQVFQDPFTTPNPALNVSAMSESTVKIQAGKAEVAFLLVNSGRAFEYGTQYGDATICATFATLATDKPENQAAGVLFWGPDYTTYYTLEVIPGSGQFGVAQLVPGGSWALPVAWTASPAVVKTMGGTNTLRVQTKGNTATLFVNDQQVGTVTGTPPAGGGLVGFWVGSSNTTATDTWDVTNFSVAIPQ
jgi:hypothetical protein